MIVDFPGRDEFEQLKSRVAKNEQDIITLKNSPVEPPIEPPIEPPVDPNPPIDPVDPPIPVGDLVRGRTITTEDGVWSFGPNGETLLNGENMRGSALEYAYIPSTNTLYALTKDAFYQYDPIAQPQWYWNRVDSIPGVDLPAPVIPIDPGVESPNASPNGTHITTPWTPITIFNGRTFLMSDTKGTKDAGAHYIGYECAEVFKEIVPGMADSAPSTPATEDGSFRPARWVPLDSNFKPITDGSPHTWMAIIAGELYGYCFELLYKDHEFYQKTGLGIWYYKGNGNASQNHIALDPFAPPEIIPAPSVGSRKLIGGWKVPVLYGHCNLTFKYSEDGKTPLKAFVSTRYETPGPVIGFDLPPMGVGSDIDKWPILQPAETIDEWWSALMVRKLSNELAALDEKIGRSTNPSEIESLKSIYNIVNYRLSRDPYNAYASGLHLGDLTGTGVKLWVCPKIYYDTAPPPSLELYARDGEILSVPLSRQAFAGIVKRGPFKKPYLGSGGDESGQGGRCGPTCATLEGRIIFEYGRPEGPGEIGPDGVPVNWNLRAPRDTNYDTPYHRDGWIAWPPRVINGVLQGRWAADRVWGGGLVLPEGIYHFPEMGIGMIDYAAQMPTFTEHRLSYSYIHKESDGSLIKFEKNGLGAVTGHELDAQGKVYLTIKDQWDMQGGKGPAIFAFE